MGIDPALLKKLIPNYGSMKEKDLKESLSFLGDYSSDTNKATEPSTDDKKPSSASGFNIDAFKYAISMIESAGGKLLETGINPKTGRHYSSAAGKYHFLYESIKKDPIMKGVSKRDFINDPDLQERVMDKAIAGNLAGYTYGEKPARQLIESTGTKRGINEVAAMIHFLGAGGAKKFLTSSNFITPGAVNATGSEYVDRFNKHFKKYNNDNSPTPTEPEVDKNIVSENSQKKVEIDNTQVVVPQLPRRNEGLDFLTDSDNEQQVPIQSNNGTGLDFLNKQFAEGG